MNKLKIAFLYAPVAFGQHRAPLDFDDLEGGKAGLTGTDLVCLYYAKELAALGHEVTLYCHAVGEEGASYDGVQVLDFSAWDIGSKGVAWDAVIATSNPNALREAPAGALRVVNRQVASFGIDSFEYETAGFDAFVDLYLVPSETAKAHVAGPLPEAARAKFRVLPNGCYPEQFRGALKQKVPGRVAYTSSPDRGLHLLLQVWPEIRAAVPNAELRIYYQSLETWLAYHCDPSKRFGGPVDHECTRRALYIRHALRRLEGHGVTRVGGVSHRQLVKELCEAEVFAYPCAPLAFTETFSVATLEACAAGAFPVISSADCLEEVHGNAAAVVRHPVGERMDSFRTLVVGALQSQELRLKVADIGAEHARRHDWRVLAKRLEGYLVEGVAAKRAPAPSVRAEVKAKARIDLVLTPYASGPEPIDVNRPFDSNSGGGCRAGFMGLVRELPKFGYEVRAYSTFKWTGKTDVGGADYRPLSEFDKDGDRDVLVAYYDTSPLVGVSGCLRVASHHTFQVPHPGAFEWTDVNLAPSRYAADALRTVYDGEAPWYVMPNAIQPDLPDYRPVRGRCVYHTSASRGLHELLEAWPEIVRRFPEATLHVVGDVAGWLTHYAGKACRQGLRTDRVLKTIAPIRPEMSAVRFLGNLSRAEVLRELSEASVFPFPLDPPMPCETFSVSMMECLAIGVSVVYYERDALGDVYRRDLRLPRLRPTMPEEFVDNVVASLEWTGRFRTTVPEATKTMEWARGFTFTEKARALDRAIWENLRKDGTRVPSASELESEFSGVLVKAVALYPRRRVW